VSNLNTLRNSRGVFIETKPTTAMCRCGGTGNKPFFDGSHWYIEFEDEKN
jgi:CDGSH-type Zn-finger protein